MARMLVSSVACGLLLGVAARLVMRFVALEAGIPAAFSPGGSLEVVAFGAGTGSSTRHRARGIGTDAEVAYVNTSDFRG